MVAILCISKESLDVDEGHPCEYNDTIIRKYNWKGRQMMQVRKSIRWNTVRILAIGFLGVILLGACLLWLPVCNQKPLAFMDALFTATSAVCVTGLVTIVPAAQFTVLGKMILLLLIQIGGLGIIACITIFFLILKKKITLKERVVLHETYNTDKLGGIVGMVRKVILGTFVVEGAGAIAYAFQFVPEYGWIRGIGYSIFHAISAFCNAGIDILGTDSLAGYAGNPLINITTMLLIVLSGIGFSVWYDVLGNLRRVYRHELPRKWWFTRLRLHSKIAIITTAALLVTGTIGILLMEYHNPDTLGGMPIGQKIMASCFQSVTTRTAGFFSIPQASLHTESKLLSCLLMFIGGSPGGTAGGVKTTTIAMLLLICIAFVRGGEDVECFGRRISSANMRAGISVVMVSFLAALMGTMAITMIEPDSVALMDIIYEVTSAIGTVGLTANLTPELERASQVVIMILMYMGRLGPITLMLTFAGNSNPRDKIRQLPKERIMIG